MKFASFLAVNAFLGFFAVNVMAGDAETISSPVIPEHMESFWIPLDSDMFDELTAVGKKEISVVAFEKLMKGEEGASPGAIANISWQDAKAFARKLTEAHRKSGLLGPSEFYRLPSVFEWQKIHTAIPLREHLNDLDNGLREFCQDTRTEKFPSRDKPDSWREVLFVAVIGAHSQLGPEADLRSFASPSWVREDTQSPVIGFRLIRVKEIP